MKTSLLDALEASDESGAVERFDREVSSGRDAWEIHRSLYPVVQKVLNPPFINPHLPKMYRIYREFTPRLKAEDIPPLVRLEVTEYAKRPKLESIPREPAPGGLVSFEDIEASIAEKDRAKTSRLMAAYFDNGGNSAELARKLLLLGSGYLDRSLGHSISCTAFILLEAMERTDEDSWPALSLLADYFQKGGFQTTPELQPDPLSQEEIERHLLRATSGRGIVNLHHTITFYAIERVRHLFSDAEHNHLLRSWVAFMGDKKAEQIAFGRPQTELPSNYAAFREIFRMLDPYAIVSLLAPMLESKETRSKIGRFLIKGVCDQYQGNYNPHYLTGPGSALFLLERFEGRHPIVVNGLFQFLEYFFSELKQ